MELALRKSSVTLTELQKHGQRKGGEGTVARIREGAMSLPTAAVRVTAREQLCSRGRTAGTTGRSLRSTSLHTHPTGLGPSASPAAVKEVMCH